ncbi:hypothetical protein PoB_006619300 [Plakobranchus ocellatus]|uniref:Uncharacterized protein n=1 Tax=Plakobranchus ocellatus TaxID=259542 RepID=A0AAV4D649_9GAST|nr:hypothetical protein PoB_006619300 [Plakobranchus ocellatus]
MSSFKLPPFYNFLLPRWLRRLSGHFDEPVFFHWLPQTTSEIGSAYSSQMLCCTLASRWWEEPSVIRKLQTATRVLACGRLAPRVHPIISKTRFASWKFHGDTLPQNVVYRPSPVFPILFFLSS